MDKYTAWILAHPMGMLGCLFCITIIFIYFGLSVRTDNSMEVWFPSHNPAVTQYRQFLDDFGNDEFILIATEHKTEFTYRQLLQDQELTRSLEKLSGVENILSLSNLFNQASLDFNAFRETVLASPLLYRTLISANGQVTALILQLSQEGLSNRQELVDEVREIISRSHPLEEQVFIAGPPIFNTELDQMSRKVAARYFPLLFCIIVLILFIHFRSFAGVFLPTYIMTLSLFATCGWMGFWGGSLNMVTIALFPLMMVLSLSYSIYMVKCYQNNITAEHGNPSEDRKKHIIARSCKDVAFPIALCALTTAVGFGSLMVSEVTPVRDFGFYAALGIATAFLLVMSFVPPALLVLPVPCFPSQNRGERKRLHHFFLRLTHFVIYKKNCILGSCLILVVLSLAGIAQLRVETHALKFFPHHSRLVQAYTFIEDHLTGLSPIEIVIGPENTQIHNLLPSQSILSEVRRLQDFLSRRDEVITSLSIADILENDIVARSSTQISHDAAHGMGSGELTRYFNPARQTIRVSAKARTLGSSDYRLLLEEINHYLDVHFGDEIRAYTTGIVPLIVGMQDKLLTYLIQSFSITIGIIALIFLFITRSPITMLVSMLPNILPIVMVLGFMGWTGIKLDVATIMIASIALGIAVDDTFHFLSEFKRGMLIPGDYCHSIQSTLDATGEAMIFTSLVNMCGFAVLCFSDFTPMVNFGFLISMSIVFALAGDLLVLPASLAAFKIRL